MPATAYRKTYFEVIEDRLIHLDTHTEIITFILLELALEENSDIPDVNNQYHNIR